MLVDYGGRDGTADAMNVAAAVSPSVRVLTLAHNACQSAALAAKVLRARGDAVATVDANLQVSPADTPELLARLEHADVG